MSDPLDRPCTPFRLGEADQPIADYRGVAAAGQPISRQGVFANSVVSAPNLDMSDSRRWRRLSDPVSGCESADRAFVPYHSRAGRVVRDYQAVLDPQWVTSE